jgi:prepilin-type N-terminal cleavage/methylation domain-containing protein
MRIVKKLNTKSTQDGFTLIELLMVILVIAILAVIGITQFVNYGKDSRDAATRANLQMLRRAIAEKNAMMRVRCGVESVSWPPVANINGNDITGNTTGPGGYTPSANTPCSILTDVPVSSDQKFISAGIPVNPWSDDIHALTASNVVYQCQTPPATGTPGTPCTGTRDSAGTSNGDCATAYGHGWCYDPVTGEIWANSARNNGDGTGNEWSF